MRYWLIGAMIALVVLGSITATSYFVLNHFYGEKYITSSIQTVTIENSGQQVTIEDLRYDVKDAEFTTSAGLDFYFLTLEHKDYTDYTDDEGALPAPPSDKLLVRSSISVQADAYEQAQATGEPVIVSSTTSTETKPIDALPIAASIGIVMGVVAFAVWVGYRQRWGDATSTLIEHGLHDMTVRDIEIVGRAMELKEFTVPELVKLTKASKITVWRTVQKLVEQGLVQPTKQTRLAANGLGGRGKPSIIYKYVGVKVKE